MEIKGRQKKEKKIASSFYLDEDVVSLSCKLLGKALFTSVDGNVTGGYITETEAYRGPEDRASHAYNNRRTARTEVMFKSGGHCYVYQCYGIHFLLNVVTGPAETPHAILIRAILPTHGLEVIQKRRSFKNSVIGPGNVTQALGINKSFNGELITDDRIWIEKGLEVDPKEIIATQRVGIDYAGEDALLPWRFLLRLPQNDAIM